MAAEIAMRDVWLKLDEPGGDRTSFIGCGLFSTAFAGRATQHSSLECYIFTLIPMVKEQANDERQAPKQ